MAHKKSGSKNYNGEANFILLCERANDFLDAAEVLNKAGDEWPRSRAHCMPIMYLLGHAVELSLKGLISIRLTQERKAGAPGDPEIIKEHDLCRLGEQADLDDLALFTPAEKKLIIDWLDSVHAAPFFDRYPQVALLSLPSTNDIIPLVRKLISRLALVNRSQDMNCPFVRATLGAGTI